MSDHDLEQIARILARTDSREMILATSDESELHHVSDSGWRDWLPHAKALVADGHISSPAQRKAENPVVGELIERGRAFLSAPAAGGMPEDPFGLVEDLTNAMESLRNRLAEGEAWSPAEVAAAQQSIMKNPIYQDHFGASPVSAFGLANSALRAVSRSPAEKSDETDWKAKYEASEATLIRLNEKYDRALKLGASEEPTDEGIAEAIRQTEYKYFGDYELSESQWDAVYLLINAAKHLVKRRSQPENSAQQVALAALENWYRQANQLHSAKLYEACVDLFPKSEPDAQPEMVTHAKFMNEYIVAGCTGMSVSDVASWVLNSFKVCRK